MLHLGSKSSPSCQTFSIPCNFWNHRCDTETGTFPWPSCYCSCENWKNYNISSYYFKHKSMKSRLFKKCQIDNQMYKSQLIRSFFFYKLFILIQKIDVGLSKTLKLKLVLLFFDSVPPTNASHTVTKNTIYPLSYWWKRFASSLRTCFATLFFG